MAIKISKIINEIVDEQKVNTIAIFDFDQTLMSSPTPENGKIIYKEKTGKDWPHIGWWSKPESLDDTIFDINLIPETKSYYELNNADKNTLMVMMTGRIPKLSQYVENLLNKNGLKFDMYLYNDGTNTLNFKINSLNKLVSSYPSVKKINMYDDREEHITPFKSWGEAQNGLILNVTHIKSE